MDNLRTKQTEAPMKDENESSNATPVIPENAIQRHRRIWDGKSDEWLFERLDNELKQKVDEIRRLIELQKKSDELLKWALTICKEIQSIKTYGVRFPETASLAIEIDNYLGTESTPELRQK